MSLPDDIHKVLSDLGFVDAQTRIDAEPLSGGVSSDIWRVRLTDKEICVKRALAQLKVEGLWQAPVNRNAYEAAWFKLVETIVPQAVPQILGHDAEAGVFVMNYLPSDEYPVWKSQLLAGKVSLSAAKQLGETLSLIHAGTACDEELRKQFATDDLFYALRVEPYLLATAERHASVAAALHSLAERLMNRKTALVHGDISPKNILLGPNGPVILDAECAWYGDPAFDLAFCLNHLLLKCIPSRAASNELLRCYELISETYLAEVRWETATDIERRAAQLLPALLLARVDGKSPVEYIGTDQDKDRVRRVATELLLEPVDRLRAVRTLWEKELLNE